MKTLNTLIISSLLALSVNATLSAADFVPRTEEMNQVLQHQIDEKMSQTLQSKNTVIVQTMVLNAEDVTDQKVNTTSS